jgi:Asp-tRNA(Asn)/Glu-tRNA(Gln) amidotransferase A subunit family amidase
MDTNQSVQQTIEVAMAKPIRAVATEKEITDIATLHERIRTQKVSPVEVVNTCLEQMEQINPKLNAFITVLADQAREQARMAESEIKKGNWHGPLHGIPWVSKISTIRPG